MSRRLGALVFACILAGCAPGSREYELKGQVLSVNRQRAEILVRHEDIPGFMEAMTMPFAVRDRRLLEQVAPGDLITARLVVSDTDAYLAAVTRTGTAPLDAPLSAPPAQNAAELLRPGDLVPNQAFVDQDGHERLPASWRGKAVVMTFIYTRCPLPTFCPLMDRHFAEIQREVQARGALQGRVQLVSVSFDPEFDTPAVLRQHAKTLEADPSVWLFVSASRDAVERFARRFGVAIDRGNAANARDLIHTLSTAVIDRSGKLVKTYPGNEWTPAEILADLEMLQ